MSKAEAFISAMDASESMPEEEDLMEIFREAVGGDDSRDEITYKEAMNIMGIQGIMEEGAITKQELSVIWGQEEVPLDFKGFSEWYCEILQIYDEFLREDAVELPPELLEDMDDLSMKEYTDEELLEDAPAVRLEAADVVDGVDTVDRPVKTSVAERDNVEITELFREQCDDQNLLSFDGLKEISEVDGMLQDGELDEWELTEMWNKLPKKGDSFQGDKIDVVVFKSLIQKIDELFEEIEDDGEIPAPKEETIEDPKETKEKLLELIQQYAGDSDLPAGMGSNEDTDVFIVKLTAQLEKWWRGTVDDPARFKPTGLLGDWELIYTTSAKMRRWGSVLNPIDDVPQANFGELVQNFTISDDGMLNEFDMEEAFFRTEEQMEKLRGGEVEPQPELAMRAAGSWNTSVCPNVLTGLDDVLIKIKVQDIEYDKDDGSTAVAQDKILETQMLRTFCYCFLAYLDEDLRIMRTDLTGRSVYIFKKLEDEPAD